MHDRQWRITALICLPKLVVAVEPPEPGSLMPKKIGFQSRLKGRTVATVQGLGEVTFVPSPYPFLQLAPESNSDLAAISLRTGSTTPELALANIESELELLLDDMSFQLQFAIRVLMLEVFDVTLPLKTGQDRETLLYPFPIGWPYPKFEESTFQADSSTDTAPVLRVIEEFKESTTRAALRWYVKALATPFDVDRFAFFWIALEILSSASSSSITRPYVAPCQHEIASCPECGKSTAKKVQGPSLIEFLKEMGTSVDDAKELWQTRQMFHGSNPLTQEAVKTLPRVLLILKSAVANAIKRIAHLSAQLPYVRPDAVGIGKAIALGGSRKVELFDLELH